MLYKKRLDKRNKANIALKPRGAINMNDIMCLGNFFEHEEIIHARVSETTSFSERMFASIYVCREIKKQLKDVRRLFSGGNYQKIVDKMSIEDMKELIPTLKTFINRQDKVVTKLEEINKSLAKPFVKSAIKNIKIINDILEDKIQDFTLAADSEFIGAVEKILDGAANHNLDINRVPNLGSFV
jgi:hypothetical protein